MKIFVALIKIISAFVFPPLSVFLQVRFRINFWINILLTLIGWVPGIIHAILVISFINQNNNSEQSEIDQLQEKIDQKRKKALAKEARIFLKELNPKSGDAIWFKEFSKNYDSRLEAAIDYLQTIKETSSS